MPQMLHCHNEQCAPEYYNQQKYSEYDKCFSWCFFQQFKKKIGDLEQKLIETATLDRVHNKPTKLVCNPILHFRDKEHRMTDSLAG
jgi:hypothetical protein